MIQHEDIAAARGRLDNDGDRSIFDEALRRAQTLDPATRDMIEMGLVLVGLVQSDIEYQRHLYPFDTAFHAQQMAMSQSGCGLATEEIWRAGRVASTKLLLSYADRVARGGELYAVTLEKVIAQQMGAWIVPGTGRLTEPLEPGDAVIIGCKGCRGLWARGAVNTEHELTVLFTEDDGVTVHSVDGGQPHIALRTRRLVHVPEQGESWLANVSTDAEIAADGRPVRGRRILGYARARLLQRYSAPPTVPPAPPASDTAPQQDPR